MDVAVSVDQGTLGEVRISIVIPVYNVERYLARCLDSVLAAARGRDCEIICVNDGSTDGSAAILERYADRVRILTKANGGLGSARNAGLDVLTGDYVMFVDSDDWIPEWAIARFAAVAGASNAALVVSTSFARDVPPAKPSSAVRWAFRPSPWIAGRKIQYCAWNKLYRADLFRTRRYPATIYEDFPVTTDILCEVGEFAAIDEPLYVYCTNANAASLVRSAFTERKLRDSVSVVRMVLETARRQEDPRLARFAFRQASDGHSSTIGQICKTKDLELARIFLELHSALVADFPRLAHGLTFKAGFRLWKLRGWI